MGGFPQDEAQKVPDRFDTEPIVGWRGWKIKVNDDPFVSSGVAVTLIAITYRQCRWPKMHALHAVCQNFRGPEERGCRHAPTIGCNCGIYVRKDFYEALQEWAEGNSPNVNQEYSAWGRASVWGRVIDHTNGVRAQFGYPYEIFVPDSTPDLIVTGLRDGYAVDVTRTSVSKPALPVRRDA